MTEPTPPNRCRVVLIAPLDEPLASFEPRLRAAIQGGDVASLIIPVRDGGEAAFQAFAEAVVPIVQAAGIAALIADDTRIAGRVGADRRASRSGQGRAAGSHRPPAGKDQGSGAGGAKTREDALELGETRPDYIFFGKFGFDMKAEPHHRNLSLGAWWAEMIQIPCIVMAGSDIASVEAVAAMGAEFVALSSAVFGRAWIPARRSRWPTTSSTGPQFASRSST